MEGWEECEIEVKGRYFDVGFDARRSHIYLQGQLAGIGSH